jgi:CheY-like chemotaxis protein
MEICHDANNKNAIHGGTHEEKEIDKWMLANGKKDKSKKNSYNNNHTVRSNVDDIKGGSNNSAFDANLKTDPNTEWKRLSDSNKDHPNGNRYRLPHNENDTPHSMPILLVDDEEDLLLTFDLLLRSEGYTNVRTFSSPTNALSHVSDPKYSLRYRLAITDIRMPEINGMHLYQTIRILNPSIKIMFLTSLDAAGELLSIYPEIRRTDVLRKPIDPKRFIDAVNDKVQCISTQQHPSPSTL